MYIMLRGVLQREEIKSNHVRVLHRFTFILLIIKYKISFQIYKRIPFVFNAGKVQGYLNPNVVGVVAALHSPAKRRLSVQGTVASVSVYSYCLEN